VMVDLTLSAADKDVFKATLKALSGPQKSPVKLDSNGEEFIGTVFKWDGRGDISGPDGTAWYMRVTDACFAAMVAQADAKGTLPNATKIIGAVGLTDTKTYPGGVYGSPPAPAGREWFGG